MNDFTSLVVDLIGAAPAGFDVLQYIVVCAFAFLLVMGCVSFISALFRWIGGL